MRKKLSVAESKALYGEQDAWGNCIADLRANLRLTMLQRLEKAEYNAKELLKLKRDLKRIDRVP